MSFLTVSEAARAIPGAKPRDISDLFYHRVLSDDLAPLVGNRRMIPRESLDSIRAALKRADFASVRGHFAFAANQGPVQDWYELAVVRGDDGKLGLKTLRKFRDMVGGAYGEECRMK